MLAGAGCSLSVSLPASASATPPLNAPAVNAHCVLVPVCMPATQRTGFAGPFTNNASPAAAPYQTYIQRVSSISANDAWAVGWHMPTSSSATTTFIEHWNGQSWSHVTSPNPLSIYAALSAVAAVSANDVWAVGTYAPNNTGRKGLIEHWNGTKWAIVPSPDPISSPSHETELTSVDAVSASDVWAVGSIQNSSHPGAGGKTIGFAEHWNGKKWTAMLTPNLAKSLETDIYDVSALSATNIWAVGDAYPPGCNQVACSPAAFNTFTEHWNGKTWTIVPSPTPAPMSELAGVSAVSANNVWAVGYADQTNFTSCATLIEHWNGKKWIQVKSPSPTSACLEALATTDSVSPNNVWAVGLYADQSTGLFKTLVEHWNGTMWTVVPSPNTPFPTSALLGVSATSASDIWAGGDSYNGLVNSSLFEHWNGSKWTIVKS